MMLALSVVGWVVAGVASRWVFSRSRVMDGMEGFGRGDDAADVALAIAISPLFLCIALILSPLWLTGMAVSRWERRHG